MRLTLLRFLCLVGCLLFLSACSLMGGNTEATTQPELITATETLTDDAAAAPESPPVFIDSLRLLVLQSDPVQVDLTINGQLPDGCTVLETVSQTQQETTFIIEVQARRDPTMPCTEALVPFNQTIPLEVADLPDGTYTVQVGEMSDSFTLGGAAASGDATAVTSGASIRGSVWHDYCDTMADGSPTPGCVDTGDGSQRGDGLFGEGESRIIGVEITLSSGACPPDGTPATDIQLTTTRTDGTGAYLFGDLPAGPHCVAINAFSDINIGILPPGIWTAPRVTEISINTTVELAPGEQKAAVDFGWDYQLAAATEQPDCTNKVTYVADVTIPDNTVLTPGQEFVKTWRLRNDGDCVWSTAYALEFVEGDPMGFTGSQPLAAAVQPGQEVDISVTLTAPGTPGTYRSDWQLSDEQGRFFGLGANANVSFYVQIVVQ